MFKKLFAFPFKPLFKAAKFFVRIHLNKKDTELSITIEVLGSRVNGVFWHVDRICFVVGYEKFCAHFPTFPKCSIWSWLEDNLQLLLVASSVVNANQ